jgi:hypothetical protein
MSKYEVLCCGSDRNTVRVTKAVVEADDFWVSPSGALIFWHPNAGKNKCAINNHNWDRCDLMEEDVDDNYQQH